MTTQEKNEHFIGRKREIQQFEDWLQDPKSPWILYFYDVTEEQEKKGGIGKTWLLRQFANLVTEKYLNVAVIMIDFFSVEDRDRLFLAEKVAKALHKFCPEWSPIAFADALDLYYTRKFERAIPQRLTDVAEDETIFTVLAAALVDDIQRLETILKQQKKTFLVIFDTFEVIENNPTIAVLRKSQTFPDNYSSSWIKVVMAGRNPLNWEHSNWSKRKSEVQVVSLHPFSKQEMLDYIDTEAIYDQPPQEEQQIDALYKRTEGRPIMIGLVVDVLNNRIQSLEELIAVPEKNFEANLIPQINKLEDPINWVVLFIAHAYHHFHMPLLERILDRVPPLGPTRSIDRAKLVERLPQLSFVRKASTDGSFVLHDEMRRLVVKYCWEGLDPDKRQRKDISSCVIEYYEEQLKRLDESKRLDASWYQLCSLVILHHRLFINPDDGLKYFRPRFLEARKLRKRVFARLLFQEVQNFSHSLSLAQQNESHLAEGQLLRLEGDPDEALNALARIKETHDPQWFKENYYNVLNEQGQCYQVKNQWNEAVQCIDECLIAETTRGNRLRCATLLNQRGYIARRRGQFDTALENYQQSADIYKELNQMRNYAYVLNNMSNVYRYQGNIEKALLLCKIGWSLRRNVVLRGEADEIIVGWSLNTLGLIHLSNRNISEAERYFNEAYEIFLRANSQKDLAAIYSRFGQVQFELRNLNEALKWFIRVQQTAVEANVEYYITSLIWQGRIAMQQERWDEAEALFERAHLRAQQVADEYQRVESLIYLAECLIAQKQDVRAQQMLKEAWQLASERDFYDLLGRIEHKQGEVLYHKDAFKEAFQHFVVYCHDMVLYNHAEYRIAVQRMIDALVGVLSQDVESIVNDITSYWKEHNLDEEYPELITACKGVLQFL
jgi:tetratricopeptide (TPR) repeat protein